MSNSQIIFILMFSLINIFLLLAGVLGRTETISHPISGDYTYPIVQARLRTVCAESDGLVYTTLAICIPSSGLWRVGKEMK